MRVFVTGATGFIGSAVVKELLGAGHTVLGLARNDEGAASLAAVGAEVLRGDLEDHDSLRRGAAATDAVIHTAFRHDWSRFAESCELDRRAIEAIGSALEGSNRPFIVSAGLAMLAQGRPATEDDAPAPLSATNLRASEHAAAAFLERGVRAMTVRLPQVHDTTRQGLITYAIQIAASKGVSAYVEEGLNLWSAVHVLDAARLYRLALEKGKAGSRFHAVAEEGVTLKEIAEAIGRGLGVPVVSKSQEEAKEHFGFLSFLLGMDLCGTSAKTRERLGWKPTGPGLIADLNNMRYPRN